MGLHDCLEHICVVLNTFVSQITRLHRRLAPYKVAVLPVKENHKLYLVCVCVCVRVCVCVLISLLVCLKAKL